MNPFDYVQSINDGTSNMMRDSANDELAEKDYNPFLTNRSLSYHLDTVLLANVVNQWAHVDKRPQYEFYKATVKPKKRFGKWAKVEEDVIINNLMHIYNCNRRVAEQYASLLSEEQKITIKDINKGG